MSKAEQVKILRMGVDAWNCWREKNPGQAVDLRGIRLVRASLKQANFRSADFFRADFRETNLNKANLSHANLCRANLIRANLNKANLSGANLGQVDLCDADLGGAKFIGANLRGANLRGANLSMADLGGAVLSKADLSGASFRRANLDQVDFSGSIFSQTDLSGASFRRANLSGKDLSGQNFSRVDLNRGNLSSANLREANFSQANLRGADLIGANLSGANLRGTDLVGTDFRNANLNGADLSAADLSAADLSAADLSQAVLSRTNLTGAHLSGADLSQANLSQAKLTRVDLRGSKPLQTNFSGADLSGANLSGRNLCGADLSEADLTTVQLFNAFLSRTTLTGACILDWNINSQTDLTDLICDFIFLNKDPETGEFIDRRPSDESKIFEPGDFQRLVQKAQSTVDLIFREGINWRAFMDAFLQIQSEEDHQEVSIKGIETAEDGSFIVKINTPITASQETKGAIESGIYQHYEEKLALIQEGHRKELAATKEGYERTIIVLEKQLDRMGRPSLTPQYHIEGDYIGSQMAENINYGGQIGVQGSVNDQAQVHINMTQAHRQDLTEAAQEIKQLLDQLEQQYPSSTPVEQSNLAAKAVEEIEKDEVKPGLKGKLTKLGQEVGMAAIKTIVTDGGDKVANYLIPLLTDTVQHWIQ